MIDYVVNGRGAFIGITKQGQSLNIALAWLDKWCPSRVEIEGFGTVAIPSEIARRNQTIVLQDLILPLQNEIKETELSPTV